jgi:hypothetical protein
MDKKIINQKTRNMLEDAFKAVLEKQGVTGSNLESPTV